jgi:DNA-binding beta-propeller fold protein YncE
MTTNGRPPFPWLRALLVTAAILAPAIPAYLVWHKAQATPSGKLYVADTFGDDVGVIDIATGQKTQLLKTGKLPHNFALTKDARTLYVTEAGSQSITAFDTATDAVKLQRIVGPIPDNPEHRKVGMDKVRAASSCKACHYQRSVGSFISGITLSPDEKELWITEMKTQRVTIADAQTLATKRQVEVINPEGTTPSNLVYHPGTHDVYVLNRNRPKGKSLSMMGQEDGTFDHNAKKGQSFITVYDPPFTTVKARMKSPFAVPYGAVFSKDGHTLYVAYRSTNKVAVFDLDTFAYQKAYEVDESPIGLLLAPDDETLMVANFYETPATVQWLDRRTGAMKKRLEVPSSPTLMVRHPRTGLVYLTASGANKIVEIDPVAMAITRTFDAGAYPIDVQLVP